MNAVENFQRILRFNQPERVISRIPVQVIRYNGNMHEDYDGSGGDESRVGTVWTDIWGTTWKKIQEDVMGLPVKAPLQELSALKDYTWPDPNDERICSKIYCMAQEYPGGDLLLGGSHRDTLWEKAYMLCGMESMMVNFLTEPEFVREVLHHIMDFQLGIAAHYLNLGVRVAFLGDDLGSQIGSLLSPRLVHQFLLPEYRRLCQLYKDNGVLIRFHSCGNVEGVLDTFLDLGVDFLNPVQATANNLSEVRRRTLGKMTLYGAVSSKILMESTPERIDAEVQRLIWMLGQDGGYICAPDQDMPYPAENRAAYITAVERYGNYPLTPPTPN